MSDREAARAAARAAAANTIGPPAPVTRPTTSPPAQDDPAPLVGPENGPQARPVDVVDEAIRSEALADVEEVRRRAREAIEADAARRGITVEVKATTSSAFVDSAGLMRSIRERGLYPPGGAKRTLNLDLPADLAEDLAALLARHPGTNRTQVLRRLVEELVAGDGGGRRRRETR